MQWNKGQNVGGGSDVKWIEDPVGGPIRVCGLKWKKSIAWQRRGVSLVFGRQVVWHFWNISVRLKNMKLGIAVLKEPVEDFGQILF